MKTGIDLRIGLSFIIIICLLGYTTYFSISTNKQYFLTIQKIQGINLFMMNLSALSSHTADLVASYRGFGFTGTGAYLTEYESSKKLLAQTKESIRQYSHQTNLKRILSLTDSLESFAGLVVRAQENKTREVETLLATQKGLIFKKELDSVIDRIENSKRAELRILENEQLYLSARANHIIYSVISISAILISILFYLLGQEFMKRKKVAHQLSILNSTLETQVKKQTETLTSVLDRISDGFVALDKNWNYTYMNKKASEIARRDPNHVVGKQLLAEFPTLINSTSYEIYREAMEKQHYVFHEEYFNFLNKWIESSVYPSQDGLTIFFRDITDRKRTEQQKKNLQQRLESVFNFTHDAILLADNSLNLVQCNPAASEILGYSAEELTTLGVKDIVMDDQRVLVLETLWPELQKRKKLEGIVLLKRKDSRCIVCHYKASAHILPGLHLAIFSDVTSQRKAESDLQESEKKYRHLFENNPMPMWLVDVDSLRFIDVNEASIRHYGYSKQQFMSMKVTDIAVAAEKKPSETIYHPELEGYLYAGIWRHLNNSGQQITVEIISHSVSIAGQIAKLVLIKDITEQIKAEKKLNVSYRQLKELTEYLNKVREEERTRIAREIHDELGQQLTGLKMDAAWISKKVSRYDKPVQDKIYEMMMLTDETILTIRRIAADLRPGILDDFGLVAALDWQSKEFEKRTGIPCSFSSTADDLEVSADLSTNLFRIFRRH